MIEVGKTSWVARLPREEAARHNSLPQSEKVRQLLARCGFGDEAPKLTQIMGELGHYAVQQDPPSEPELPIHPDISLYVGDPVSQARILLHERATRMWKSGEAYRVLAGQNITDIITPEQWIRHHMGEFEGELYLDLKA